MASCDSKTGPVTVWINNLHTTIQYAPISDKNLTGNFISEGLNERNGEWNGAAKRDQVFRILIKIFRYIVAKNSIIFSRKTPVNRIRNRKNPISRIRNWISRRKNWISRRRKNSRSISRRNWINRRSSNNSSSSNRRRNWIRSSRKKTSLVPSHALALRTAVDEKKGILNGVSELTNAVDAITKTWSGIASAFKTKFSETIDRIIRLGKINHSDEFIPM